MLKAIEAYLALRRATGFAMLNAEYLLKSFAAFATDRGKCMSLCASCPVEDTRHELPPVNHFGAPHRAALSHRVENLRSAEVDGRRFDARRPADPRDQVPENPPGAAARHGSSGLEALFRSSPAPFQS